MTPEIEALFQVAHTHLAEAAHQLRVADRPNTAARNAYLGALAAAHAEWLLAQPDAPKPA